MIDRFCWRKPVKGAVALLFLLSMALFFGLGITQRQALAEGVQSPYFQSVERIAPSGDTRAAQTLNILINLEDPPFGYRGRSGEMRGFNVDLVRALCRFIDVECKLRSAPHALILAELQRTSADIALSLFEPSAELRQAYVMTHTYFKTPARFFTRIHPSSEAVIKRQFANEVVGVVKGSGHERFLRDVFKRLNPLTYDSEASLFEAVEKGLVDYGFADGLVISFWLLSQGHQACCHFIDGPYLDSRYFGAGRAMVLRKQSWRLRQQLDIALIKLQKNGVFTELYLKHFPLGFY